MSEPPSRDKEKISEENAIRLRRMGHTRGKESTRSEIPEDLEAVDEDEDRAPRYTPYGEAGLKLRVRGVTKPGHSIQRFLPGGGSSSGDVSCGQCPEP